MGIPGPAADAMRRYLAVREECPTGALFTCEGRRVQRSYIRSILRRLCPKAGVPAITMHGLRHTCATLMLDTGASIGDVQAQLGHRHIATTLRYDRARRTRADKAGNALTAALTSHM
jgi:integrase